MSLRPIATNASWVAIPTTILQAFSSHCHRFTARSGSITHRTGSGSPISDAVLGILLTASMMMTQTDTLSDVQACLGWVQEFLPRKVQGTSRSANLDRATPCWAACGLQGPQPFPRLMSYCKTMTRTTCQRSWTKRQMHRRPMRAA